MSVKVNEKKRSSSKDSAKQASKAFKNADFYRDVSGKKNELLFAQLRTTADGLISEEALFRSRTLGRNEINEAPNTWESQLFKTFQNPFILLLSGLGIISYLTHDVRAAIVMASMVTVSVFLTFIQEYRSSQAAEKLKLLVSTKATVSRISGFLEGGGRGAVKMTSKREIPVSELVPGDLIHLSAGDMIPADIRLITAKDLFVSQASLTGEALPIEKFAEGGVSSRNVLELPNICFMGSNVISGSASALVIKTGMQTYVGSIATALSGEPEVTSFDEGIKKFTWMMLRFMAILVPLVFVSNGFTKGDWFESFLFAVAVAVGLTPEMLPMIVTVNLAKGALSMSKQKVIVKKLSAIQNFGAIDVLCTDKTGTLTEDNVVLEKYVDVMGNENPKVLEYAYLNSFHQTGLKNLLDRAILKRVESNGVTKTERQHLKIDEIPFDFSRRRMSVVVSKDSSHLLICKGALEEMFVASEQVELNGTRIPLTEEIKKQCLSVAQNLNDDGLRVVAVGYKETLSSSSSYSVKDEANLVLLGFVAFLDPPKETAIQAIQALRRHGVDIKILTGDNDRVTRKVCSIVGVPAEKIVLGHEMEMMSENEIEKAAEEVSVFAKLNPVQKEKLVRVLRSQGKVVGFMGDGINDAPALKAADVGISVDNAVDVAKESADIILLEKNLLVLEQGIIEGRRIFGNIIKYIKMGASSNFGNVFSVLGSSILLPFLPMLPVQLLTQNLLYDISQTAIPFDNIDPEYLEKPRRWEIGNITRFMFFMGPVSSLFDFATFAVMWFVFKANHDEVQSLFQSGWFVEGLLSQTLVVHLIRTEKIPFLQSRASASLVFMTVVIMALGLYVPFSPLGSSIGLTPLPMRYLPWLVGILVSYCICMYGAKRWFTKKYGIH